MWLGGKSRGESYIMGRGQAKENEELLLILVHTKNIGMYTDPDWRVFSAGAPRILSLQKEWVISLPAWLCLPHSNTQIPPLHEGKVWASQGGGEVNLFQKEGKFPMRSGDLNQDEDVGKKNKFHVNVVEFGLPQLEDWWKTVCSAV